MDSDTHVDTFGLAVDVVDQRAIPFDDPAETYHDASKFQRSIISRQVIGSRMLAASRPLQIVATRASKRYEHLPHVALPEPQWPAATFGATIEARRSVRAFTPQAVALPQLATVLHAAYGRTHALDTDGVTPLRATPSGGALYPLELYVAAVRVDGLEPALYHFDPMRFLLERLDGADAIPRLERTLVQPELLRDGAFTIVMSAMFMRTRFKYGLRGYRFALIEAGHCAQNALLAATALGLAAVPNGGFYDGEVEALLHLDGVRESVLYMLSFGAP